MNDERKLLIIGVGNSARSDDGLAWECLRKLNILDLPVDVQYRFQLEVEDASLMTEYNTVLVIDASKNMTEAGFSFNPCISVECSSSFTTHRLDPSTVLWLCRELYDHNPEAFVLEIEGVEWAIGEGLSKKGRENLDRAASFVNDWISRNFIAHRHHGAIQGKLP
jgi:hydrogenase maturation protease